MHQVYFKCAEPPTREIFINKPVPEFEPDPSQYLQLLKPSHGICGSGDLWHETINKHNREDLCMTSFRSDPALYALIFKGLLKGLSGGYFDGVLRAGDKDFMWCPPLTGFLTTFLLLVFTCTYTESPILTSES